MRLTALVYAFGLAAMIGAGAEAQTIACGTEHTVARGDTLQRLVNRAYGPGKSWSILYKANKDVIGANPSLIEVGMVLRIPCGYGEQAKARSAAAAPAPATGGVGKAALTSAVSAAQSGAPVPAPTPVKATTAAPVAAAVAADHPMIRFVTATDWAPFTNQDQPQGGMITEIVNDAMAAEVDENQYKIDFINDWSAHLQPLISDLAYDFTFPWFKPNCAVRDKLGPGSQFRCDNLAWSDPLFEQIIGYYMRADDANKPADHRGLFGRTICRPAGYSTFMMEEKDLVEPNIKFVSPSSPADCFEMLANGEADAVVLASMVADDAIARGGMADQIEEQPQLATIATLHAVTSINNPRKEAEIATINAGIKQLRESGKWFEIVQRHLIAHARITATN